MRFEESPLPGCYQIQPAVHPDGRGRFVKTFSRAEFLSRGLACDWAESFYSVSRRGVLRGLHFQRPPHHHAKLVHCSHGRLFDAVVDLRRGSPTQGRFATFELDAERGNQIYIPAGFAHGCYALTEGATIVYHVTSAHAPQHDAGIRWDSAGIPWPDGHPLLSERDRGHPPLQDFDSPFAMVDGLSHGG
ncbi:dTDP-4-dehydrorhamnose 3,5-epimerase family protein [Paracidovorax anthurii]|uniref:dTDP-4-dehydrorhamnose 3,5-epimerase n=1 Tax=Paracidovorax anthurii TaxID=78229 RepID=A0A328Z468_9BURK|nr:dTDP-4-dehydrorhamnose 3,5-epimerase family protein [Paracidovorax anthurii]RAR79995.1 dTDP-4-dehydrorhamnose 3,5-epimerase [Paracidovorax anthurii]